MELRAIQSRLPESALKWDPLKIQYQGRSVGKKSSDSVNVSSPNERKSIVARASLSMENTPRGDRKHGSLNSRKLFGGQYGLESGRRRAGRDVGAKASLSEPGSPEAQEWLFKSIFEEELLDRGIYVSGNQERELLPINFNSRVSDVPEEWRKSFLIARGQTCEKIREEGHNLNDAVIKTNNSAIELAYNNEFHKVPRDQLLSILPRIFKEKSKEGEIVWRVKDIDSCFTCLEVYQDINKLEGDKILYKLQDEKYNQELWELEAMQISKEELEKKYHQDLENLDKKQGSKFIDALKKDLSQQDNMEYIKYLMIEHKAIKNILEMESKSAIREYEFFINKQKKELGMCINRQELYYMMMGTPEVRNVVEKLPKDYTVDSLTVEKKLATGSLWPIYKVGLSIKRVDSADKKHDAKE